MNIFEEASKLKVRFASNKGSLAVEDVWDLPLTSTRHDSLDTLAKAANKYLKETAEESFVNVKTTCNTLAQLRLDILKYIIAVKLTELGTANDAIVNKARKQKLLEILANKQDAKLQEMDVADIEKLLAEL